jgi:hypothetical protein
MVTSTRGAASSQAPNGNGDGLTQPGGRGATAEVGAEHLAGGEHPLHGAHQQVARGRLAQEVEPELQRPGVADLVGDVLAHDVGRRAVHWLEQAEMAALGFEVDARDEVQAAYDTGHGVRQAVAESCGSADSWLDASVLGVEARGVCGVWPPIVRARSTVGTQ